MKELSKKSTPLTESEAALALYKAWKTTFDDYPSQDTLALLWAQCALETGRWRYMFGYNFGNVKANSKYEGFVQYYRCSEIINGKEIWFDPPHEQCRFRAFENAEGGAEDYIKFLLKSRYEKSLVELHRGRTESYVKELRLAGYFTASLDLYMTGMVRLTAEFNRRYDELIGETIKNIELEKFKEEKLEEIESEKLKEAEIVTFEDDFITATTITKDKPNIFTMILEFIKTLLGLIK